MRCRSVKKNIRTFREFFQNYREEVVANAVSGGGVAGLTGDPPVFLGKKKKPITRQMLQIKKKRA